MTTTNYQLSFVATLLLLASCSGRSTQTPTTPVLSDTPKFIVLTIDTVRVSPQRPGAAGKWDGVAKEASSQCGFVKTAVTFLASPVAGMLAAGLCNAKAGEQIERDPQAPDLVLMLETAEHVFRTPIVRDSYYHDFSYSFLIPTRDIPTNGIKLKIVDQDGEVPSEGELMGRFWFDKTELTKSGLQRAKEGELKN